MQSPAEFEAGLQREIARRVRLLERLDADAEGRGIVRRIVMDPTWAGLESFACDWAWTFDPRRSDTKNVPWIPWPRQLELLRELYDAEVRQRPLFIDKSRDTGVTWAVVIYGVWRWLTVPGWTMAIGSRKADLLDRLGDSKSVFAKVRHVIDSLPTFLRPVGFTFKRHSAWARVQNPANGALIGGEAGADMGRGGRSSLYFLDEFGKMTSAEDVDAAVAGNTNVVVYATTATGPGTRAAAQRSNPSIRRFEIGWEDDPRKAPGFRDRMLEDFGPEIVAREYDRNWDALSAVNAIPLGWIRAAVGLKIDSKPTAPVNAGLDVADGGSAESVCIVRRGGTVVALEHWTNAEAEDVVATGLRGVDVAQRHGATSLRIDRIGVGAGAVGAALRAAQGGNLNVIGVNVADSPTTTRYPDDGEKNMARDRFINLRIELWWQLRLRFQRTAEFVRDGALHDPDDLISIPNDPTLIAQLSAPRLELSTDGRMKLESKESMAKRGIRSPDRADALVLAFGAVKPGLDLLALIPDVAPQPAKALQGGRKNDLFM